MKTVLAALLAVVAVNSGASAASTYHKPRHHTVVVVKKPVYGYGHRQHSSHHSKESAWGRPIQKIGI